MRNNQNIARMYAQRSRGAYADTADMVAKLGIMAGDAFGGNQEVLAFAEQINKQFTISGTNTVGRYRLVCETPGAAGNDYTGALMAVTFAEGLTSAELQDILIPGSDAEEDEVLRARYLEYLSNKPFGGNVADYRQNIRSMDGVGGVQIYPTWDEGTLWAQPGRGAG